MKTHTSSHRITIRSEGGFSITELMVAMGAFVLVIASSVSVFVPLINQSKQQGKISETQIEGLVGLDILRRDIENAGYGLPWDLNGLTYSEAIAPADIYNDAQTGVPRALVSGNNVGMNNSDYLVIKSAAVATNNAAHKWTYIVRTDPPTPPRKWGNPDEDLVNGDNVILIQPVASSTRFRELVVSDIPAVGTFFTTFNDVNFNPNFLPVEPNEKYLIFGINSAANPRMPFNRADYYLSNASVPQRCALGTAVLTKSVINHGGGITPAGGLMSPLSLLDCVADFQVTFSYDTNGDGVYLNRPGDPNDDGQPRSDLSFLSAEDIRNRVKMVNIFILAHEGQRDPYYTYSPLAPIVVGESNVDLNALLGPDWTQYRWKVYTLIIDAENLE